MPIGGEDELDVRVMFDFLCAAKSQREDRQMIDDRTVYHLLDHIVCEVLDRMRRDGKTLEEIDEYDLGALRKKDRIALYERMAELRFDGEEGDAIAAHLRSLKHRKRSSQLTPSPATVIPLRPENRPDL